MNNSPYTSPASDLSPQEEVPALITNIKKPKLLWLIVVWIFFPLGTTLRTLITNYDYGDVLTADTVSQLLAATTIALIILMIGVGILNRWACYIAGTLFTLLASYQTLILAWRINEMGIVKSLIAFFLYGIIPAFCAYWLLRKKNRVLYSKYAHSRHNAEMQKMITKQLLKK